MLRCVPESWMFKVSKPAETSVRKYLLLIQQKLRRCAFLIVKNAYPVQNGASANHKTHQKGLTTPSTSNAFQNGMS